MYGPHTVTLYNVTTQTDPDTLKDTAVTNITVLEGVLLDAVKAENVRAAGQQSADGATLYIPFDIKAADGLTGEIKSYVGPKEYLKAADKSKLWTMATGGGSFFVKGRVVIQGGGIEEICASYDDVYVITAVDAKDYGGQSMRHWEVSGR